MVFSGFCAVTGFIAGTPYALLDYKTFIRKDGPKGALWQFNNVGSVDPLRHISKFIEEMVFRVADDVGYVVLAGFFIVVVVLIFKILVKKFSKKDYTLWFIVIPALLSFIYISGFDSSRSHYYMIAYPFVSIVYAYIIVFFTSLLKKSYIIEFLGVVLLIFPLFYFSVVRTYTFTREDTRNLLYKWADQNLEVYTPIISGNDSDIFTILASKYSNVFKGYSSYYEAPMGLGYLVVSVDEESPELVFERYTYLPKMKLVFSVDNTLRKGPIINIYEYTK